MNCLSDNFSIDIRQIFFIIKYKLYTSTNSYNLFLNPHFYNVYVNNKYICVIH